MQDEETYDATRFEFTFDQDVVVTRTLFPPFSLSQFLSNLGGSLGLWLGLGVLQLCTNLMEVALKMKQIFRI